MLEMDCLFIRGNAEDPLSNRRAGLAATDEAGHADTQLPELSTRDPIQRCRLEGTRSRLFECD